MIRAVTLSNAVVFLEPLQREHEQPLAEAAADGELWNLWYTSVPRPEAVGSWIVQALSAYADGREVPFVIRLIDSGRVVGTTRYLHIAEEHKRLEVGATWIARSCHGTAVNPGAKLALLEHAFNALGMNRVEFLTHSKNAQSRAALTKLGALQEGILRSHKVLSDGSLRDSVVFSIVACEWPRVRAQLEQRLRAAAGPSRQGAGDER